MTRGFAGRCLVGAVVSLLGFAQHAAASDYTPLVQRGSSSFNTLFSPVPVAVPGGGTLPNSIAFDSNEAILFSFIGTNSGLKWRAFLPPGTKYFQATLYTFASPPATKVVARFENLPIGGVADVTPLNAAAIDNSTVLRTLVAGAELPFYSPESAGSLKLSSRGSGPESTARGGWVYFNTLQVPGDQIFKIETTVTVDETCYRSWFANAQFDVLGNPAEGAVHTCAGSTGGPTVIPLTGISLSTTSLVKGSGAVIVISPQPSNATLPGCSVQSTSNIPSLLNVSGSTISLGAGAAAITKTETATITCGTASAVVRVEPSAVALTGISLSAGTVPRDNIGPISILPVPSNASLSGTVCAANSPELLGLPSPYVNVIGNSVTLNAVNAIKLTENRKIPIVCALGGVNFSADLTITVPLQVATSADLNGNLVLNFNLAPNPTDFDGVKVGKSWVAAKIPAIAFLGSNDSWFFRTKSGWATLVLPNPDSVVFDTYTPLALTQNVSVALGLPESVLRYYSVEIHLGYQSTAGQFKNLGKIWP